MGAVRQFLIDLMKTPSMSSATASMLLNGIKLGIEADKARILAETSLKAGEQYTKSDQFAATLVSRVKLPNKEGKEKEPKLELPEAALNQINAALANTDDTTKAIKTFTDGVTKQKDAILASQSYDPKPHQDELCRLQYPLLQAIKRQQEKELEELKKLFQDTTFQKTLTDEGKDPKEIEPLMTRALEKYHQEQKDNLNNAVKQNHANTQRAEATQLLCAIMARNNANKAQLDALKDARMKAQAAQQQNLTGEQEDPHDQKRFVGMDVKNLKDNQFKTESGKCVVITPDGDRITLQSKKFGFGITADDTLNVALAGRAMGWTTITMEVSHPDPKIQLRMAKDAYESCLKAGFDPKKIEIKTQNDKGEYIKRDPGTLGVDVTKVESLLSKEPAATPLSKHAVQQVRDSAPIAAPAAQVQDQGPAAAPQQS